MTGHTLSLEADGDLLDIYEYTESTWGEAQATAYMHGIFRTFDVLQANPSLGRERPELIPGLRSHAHRNHVIFYLLQKDGVVIARVLHGSMDIESTAFDVQLPSMD